MHRQEMHPISYQTSCGFHLTASRNKALEFWRKLARGCSKEGLASSSLQRHKKGRNTRLTCSPAH